MSQGIINHPSDFNLIKRGFGGRFTKFGVDLARRMGSQKAGELYGRVATSIQIAVTSSFAKGNASMRHVTSREIDRRIDLSVDLVLAHDAAGWPVVRICDELSRLLLEELQAKDKSIPRPHTWVRT